MKTSLINAVMIYECLGRMADTPMDYTSAHAMVLTRGELEPHVTFFVDKERELLSKYAKDAPDENGKYTIPAELVQDFRAEREQLYGVEVEIKKRVLKKLPETITPSALSLLMSAFELPEEVDTANG